MFKIDRAYLTVKLKLPSFTKNFEHRDEELYLYLTLAVFFI